MDKEMVEVYVQSRRMTISSSLLMSLGSHVGEEAFDFKGRETDSHLMVGKL